MRKVILKKSRYGKLPINVFGLTVFLIFGAHSLFEILSGEQRTPDIVLTGTLFFFLAGIIFFTWQIFSKKQLAEYININGWQYRLFLSASKWTFICISGAYSSIRIMLLVALFFIGNFIKNDASILDIILISLGCMAASTVPYGYFNYKIYQDVDMGSDAWDDFGKGNKEK